MTQAKNLNTLPEVSTLSTTDRLLLFDSNGKAEKISPANLKTAIGTGIGIDDVMDNVFIMYHRAVESTDNHPVCCRPSEWTTKQNSGEIATGVLLIDGGRKLVIAPTENASMAWWSSGVSGGNTAVPDRLAAQEDYAGKANTSKIIATLGTDSGYAPGYCYSYSRVNKNGKGSKAGSWWLPSLGELYLMFANFTKINYALSKINGATLLQRNAYWSSTEGSAASAWGLYLHSGTQYGGNKSTTQHRVRPVSAFASAT